MQILSEHRYRELTMQSKEAQPDSDLRQARSASRGAAGLELIM